MTYLDEWQQNGYLILRQVLDPARVERLRVSAERSFRQYVEHSSPDSEPGGRSWGPKAWLLSNINHPMYYQDRRADMIEMLNAIGDEMAVDVVREVLRNAPAFLQANLYFDPPEGREGTWHRDCQFFAEGDEAKEIADFFAEAEPPREVHMHIPLIPSQATGVVPGSHSRWDTPEELEVRRNAPMESMPGGMRLSLEPGDLGFFHVNSIHRGFYEKGVPRRTIAVTFGRSDSPRVLTKETMKSRVFPCNYQPWCATDGYLDGVSPSARALFESFVELYRGGWNEHVDLLTEPQKGYFAAW